jgi:bifunctional aspartokinase / homoserine dehydrogenase 1
MCPEEHEASLSMEGEPGPPEGGGRLGGACAFSAPSAGRPSRESVVVFKFGGSSLLGAERMLHSAGLVRESAVRSRVCVVVSAMKGVTDRLLAVAELLAKNETQKARRQAENIAAVHLETLEELGLAEGQYERVEQELEFLSRDLLDETAVESRVPVNDAVRDRLASFGERYAVRLFAAAIRKIGVPAVPVASSDFVLTCETFRDAKPHLEPTGRQGREILAPLLEAGIVPVVTGFIGATEDGRITTLGRNSSDFSGALVAHVVAAEELVIWTDVDGIYTANPHDSHEAKLFDELSYDQAHALAASGAKVLHPQVLPLAAQTEMTVWVKNTFKPQARGTRIGSQQNGGVA